MAEGDPIETIVEALASPDPSKRFEATERLARTRSKDAVEPLIRAASDPSLLVRMGAINALGDIGAIAAEAIPVIVGAMRDPALVRNGLVAFARIGSSEPIAAKVIREKLSDPAPDIRAAAAEALWRTERDPSVASIMIDVLGSASIESRIVALRVLGEIGDRSAIPAIAELLFDDHPELRREAAPALALLAPLDDDVQEKLEALLDDPIDAVRLEAALALIALGDPNDRCIEVLAQIAAPTGDTAIGYEDEGRVRYARRPKDRALRAAALKGLRTSLDAGSGEIRAAASLALAALEHEEDD